MMLVKVRKYCILWSVAKLCHISLHGVANASIHALKLNVVKYECQFPLINLQLHIS